ncbi:hypothetical protein LVW35_08140 [Pseudomonas sp. HN11]|uniref:hypothetical protein n=1 Tax=Pseudomonas sp. HN11 TaxID=1344094 RepID=UPI001F43CE42|nr:hypothetical protein [Pseudomonas sp. HN11]UII73134.1 hypothetical protein LVW35_08140 [Pseudomonas sp. HN11]
MHQLEKEIDHALKALDIRSKKLEFSEIASLIQSLTKKFFKSERNVLDPVQLNEKSTEQNPNFWQEIQHRISQENLVLLVFDSAYRAWKIPDAQDIAVVLGETTGYPFWVTDQDLTFLMHLDDHDCVIWA